MVTEPDSAAHYGHRLSVPQSAEVPRVTYVSTLENSNCSAWKYVRSGHGVVQAQWEGEERIVGKAEWRYVGAMRV